MNSATASPSQSTSSLQAEGEDQATSEGSAQSTRHWQRVSLCQVYPKPLAETETDVDIIAIHGLDTRSPDTWVWRASSSDGHDKNWLADLLPENVKAARIFYCDWPADLLQKSVSIPTTLEESARYLLGGLRQHLTANRQAGQERPILFIASCLGGIILIKALEIDNIYDRDKYDVAPLRRATRGIVFLATPFRGTAFKDMPYIILKGWALLQDQTVTALIEYTKGATSNIDDLVDKFIQLRRVDDYHVFLFWEACKTNLLHKFHMAWLFSGWILPALLVVLASACVLQWFSPWLSITLLIFWLWGRSSYQPKLLVDEHSAKLPGFAGQRLERVHVLMNKFSGPNCKDWKQVARKIEEMVTKIRQGTPLKQADAWIRHNHYTTERLEIERLSGDPLPMDQCYINLAIVEGPGKMANPLENMLERRNAAPQTSPFSLFARLNVETPNKNIQVALSSLFDSRKISADRTIQPKRILIRGSAGVGKTTMCKKMVHDFNHGAWKDLFDRVLWVPLRRLKEWSPQRYNLEELFSHEYFAHHVNRKIFAKELLRIVESCDGGRTLFILDGLDEVSHALSRDDHKSDFLRNLLDQPNVIITSRPHTSLPVGVRSPDLELEAIGFYPDQVKEYLRSTFTDPKKVGEIQIFLQRHQLIQGLVRIPIQLDALCYTWDCFGGKTIPQTMTDVYKRIEENLWKKDILRLEKKHEGMPVLWSDIVNEDRDKVESFVSGEIYFLEGLAFTGLCNDVIDFTPERWKAISKEFKSGTNLLLDRTLPCLSFLRTSDPSTNMPSRCYHFLHLTFQEYFAARYFVRQWQARQRLKYLKLNSGSITYTEPMVFLQRHKYNAGYDIFWRFVAGLLDAEDDADTLHFFETIEQEPCDLLGATHQRLVMHCLSEVALQNERSNFAPLRTELEDLMSRWLIFECKFRRTSQLARERELPQRVLGKAVKQSSDNAAATLLEALYRQPEIPSSTLELTASWLRENISKRKCLSILAMLGSQQGTLSSDALQAVAARLNDRGGRVRQRAVEVLGGRLELPSQVLQAIVARLDDRHRLVRQAAVEVLKRRSELPSDVLQDLAACLKHPVNNVRQAAVEVLGGQPELAYEVVQAIAARLNDQDNNVRNAAVLVVRRRLDIPYKVLQDVAAQLGDQDNFVRQAAVEVLGRQSVLPSNVLQDVAALLTNQDSSVQKSAVEFLGSRPELPSEVLHAVVAQLDNPDDNVRLAAVKVLGRRSELPSKALHAVVARLNDREWLVRQRAVEVLGGRPELPSNVLQAVAARLNDLEDGVRLAAVKVLGCRPELPSNVLQAVAARLNDPEWPVQEAALKLFERRSDLPYEVLQAVAARLDDQEDWLIRQRAVELLGGRPELPYEVLQAVAARLDDLDSYVRQAVVEFLRRRSKLPSNVLKDVAALLNNQYNSVRRAAVEALGCRPDLPYEVLHAVTTQLEDQDRFVRQAAVEVLRRRLELPSDVLQDVAALLNNQYNFVRQAAVEVLRDRPELPPEMLHAVLALLNDSDWLVRQRAVELLGGRPEPPSQMLHAIVERLDDEHRLVQQAALNELEKKSDLPLGVLQAVVARLEDEDNDVRNAAVLVVRRQSDLPYDAMQVVAEQLKNSNNSIRQNAVIVLLGQSELRPKILQAVAARLDDPDEDVRWIAVSGLEGRSGLPSEVLQAVAARLEDSKEIVKVAAVRVLTSQSALPFEVVNRCMQSLYLILLQVCFEEHLAWYTADDMSYVVAAHGEIPLKGHQPWLSDVIRETRKDLSIPEPKCDRPLQHSQITKALI